MAIPLQMESWDFVEQLVAATRRVVQGNLAALMDALNKAKPASSKGVYLRKLAVSSTMGLGVRVDLQSLQAQ